jgi:hypothetical protein
MKLTLSLSRLRLLSLLIFCSLFFLIGCGSSSLDQTANGNTNLHQFDRPIGGAVFLRGEPVSEAQVQLRLNGNVLDRATTGETGDFLFLASKTPETFPLDRTDATALEVTTTVDGATLTASVPIGESYTIVNELTTLVHDYLLSHPGATYAEASRAVALSLGIPADEDLTRLSDSDIFDPATLVQVAEGQGGLNAFLSQLAPRCDSEDFDFSAPDPYRVLEVIGQDAHRRVDRSGTAVAASSIFGFVGEYLAKKVLGKLESKAWGWFFGLFDSNTGPSLDDIVERLSAIEIALADLAEKLELEFTEQRLKDAFNTLSNSSSNLTSFAQFQRDANPERPPVTDEPAPISGVVTAYLDEVYGASGRFSPISARAYATQFFDYMLNRTPSTSIVTEYNKFVTLNLGIAPSSNLAFYDVRSNGLTRKLQDNLNFGISNIDLAMDMLVNASHSGFLLNPDLSGPYSGNRLPSDIGLARAFILASSTQSVGGTNDSAALRRRALQLVPPTLPRDDIMTLPMITVAGDTPTIAYRGGWRGTTNDPYTALYFPQAWSEFPNRIGAPWKDNVWLQTTRAQVQAIEALARTAGNTNVKAGFVRLGFFPNEASVPDYFVYAGSQVYTAQDPLGNLKVGLQAHQLGAPNPVIVSFERFDTRDKKMGRLYVRSSLSGGTQAQANTILATGTTVKPTITVSEPSPGKLKAVANYQFSNGQKFDVEVTDRVEWLSSNTARVEVSNLDSDADNPAGTLILKMPTPPEEPVTITAALLTDFANPQAGSSYVTGTFEVEVANDQETLPILKEIEITPRNRIYTSTGTPAAYFYCSGFIGENRPSVDVDTFRANDLTNAVTWTLLDSNGDPVNPSLATISNSTGPSVPGGILRLLSSSLGGTYTVRAEYRNSPSDPEPAFVDETKIGVQL